MQTAKNSQATRAAPAASAARSKWQQGPFAFTAVKSVDEFEANTHGPRMRLEVTERPSGSMEQSLHLAELKLTLASEAPPAEPTVTVSRRRPKQSADASGRDSFDLEVLISKRNYSSTLQARKRSATSVSTLLDELDQSTSRQRSSSTDTTVGDASLVASLVENAARTYGTSPSTLVDAVVRVAPPELGAACVQILAC